MSHKQQLVTVSVNIYTCLLVYLSISLYVQFISLFVYLYVIGPGTEMEYDVVNKVEYDSAVFCLI